MDDEDMTTVAHYYDPTQAHIVQGCLQAAGVPAMVADANLVQCHGLLTPALGGVRILVLESWAWQARRVIAAFERGDFAIDDETETGPAV